MKLRRNQPDKVQLDMTPMIDVVFLLLIFFMVSTTFDHPSQLDVSLPDSHNGDSGQEQPDSREIVIDAAGRISVDDRLLTDNSEASLRQALGKINAAHTAQGKPPALVLRADKATPHGIVVRVMDVAAGLGLTQLMIATVHEQEAQTTTKAPQVGAMPRP